MIQFYSTNHKAPNVNLADALLTGQAPDLGLYLPESIPQLDSEELRTLKDKSYAEIAFAVLSKYTGGVFSDVVLKTLCKDAYNYDVPLEHITNRTHILRLDGGPTASFKDFAARMMARMFGELLKGSDQELVILTATSGDTGSAVANAFLGVPNVKVMVLFPPDEVSERQRKQMTTLSGNIRTVALDGKFDNCQALVKQAFADPNLEEIRLSSANSINIGRLLPQIVYYIYAYVRLAEIGEPIQICVPSGNFGNMMGALLAKRMGLPIERLIIATNANDEVPVFFRTEEYHKIEPSRVCISNAMNVGHPSNFARVIDLYRGWIDQTGLIHRMPDLKRLHEDLWTVSVTDEETRTSIRSAWQNHNLLLEPHGAVGWAGLKKYQDTEDNPDALTVCVETAHPAKFPEEIEQLLGIIPDTPPSLQGLEDKPEFHIELDNDYPAFRDLLKETYGA
ncbi:threonine synthase [candidate division KSB1 bacterium]|nr:threonine synthase [candidate division KSB1 bacterium]